MRGRQEITGIANLRKGSGLGAGGSNAEDGENGNTSVLRDAVVDAYSGVVVRRHRTKPHSIIQRTLATGLEKSGAPFDLGTPPHVMSLLMASRHGALDEPVTAEVIAILDDLVTLLRMLLFRRPAVFFFL